MKYHAQVLYGDNAWSASIVDTNGAHTYSRTLRGLEHEIREAIAAADDLSDAEMIALTIEYDWQNTSEEIREAVRVGEQRALLDEQRRVLLVEGLARAKTLVEQGMPVRDVAQLIGVSPGRVSQILNADRVG
jgi:hypothetical protein